MEVVHSSLLQCESISQDLRTLISKLVLLGLRGTEAIEVAPREASTICSLDTNFGVHVIHGRLFQSTGIRQDTSSLESIAGIFHFGSRGTPVVVATEQGRIHTGNSNLRMEVVHSSLLQCESISQDLRTLISKLVLLGLRGTEAIEVAPREASTICSLDTNFGVHVIHGRLFQSTGIRQDTSSLESIAGIFHFGSRGTPVVVATEQGSILCHNLVLRMHIGTSCLLELCHILHNIRDFICLLILQLFRSRGAIEEVATLGCTVRGQDGLFGVEECDGEVLEGTGVG